MIIRSLLKKMVSDSEGEEQKKYFNYNIIIILVSFIAFFGIYFFLPDQIPVLHEGSKSILLPKLLGCLLPPVFMIGVNLTFVLQRRISKLNTIILGIIFIASFIYYVTLI